jgi:hypothetical protein
MSTISDALALAVANERARKIAHRSHRSKCELFEIIKQKKAATDHVVDASKMINGSGDEEKKA